MEQKRELVTAAFVFLLSGILLTGLYLLTEKQSILRDRERYRYIAASQSNNIRDCIDTVLARAYTLKALVTDNDGGLDFFDRQSELIYQETKNDTGVALKNVAAAPGGTVEKVYPSTGNEALIGFDFMDQSKTGNAEAIAAYQMGKLIITNPFELVQGGIGLAGRLPVFLTDNGTESFRGLVTVTMDFQDLMSVLNLNTLPNMGVNYILWYRNEDGEREEIASSDCAPKNPVSYEFTIENLIWHLDVAPLEGWVDYGDSAIVFFVILLISLMISLLLLNRGRMKKANIELQRLAHLDSLTSCYSRHYMNTVLLDQRNGLWKNPGAKYSIAVIDIDCFKSINDIYGHEVGDRALIAIAQVLEDNGRHASGDCVIRHGGDEFTILYNDLSRERFVEKLESVLKGVQEICFPDYPDLKLYVSIGAVPYESPEASLYYSMIRSADVKLYQAKKNGKNQFVL